MAELRRIVEGLGGTDVATVLNSGNVVFRHRSRASSMIATGLATAIEATLGFPVPVIAKTASEFAAILTGNPFAGAVADPARLLVAFSQESACLQRLSSLAPLASPTEALVVGAHAAYLHCPAGVRESRVGTALLGKSGESFTTRNWATCLKLGALLTGRGDG